ncbi:hypothetical protein GQ53DRAFT_664706, partial [Thozetella sp. PMI_491]
CFYEKCSPKEALTALNITSIICDVPVRDLSVGMRVFVVVATLVASAAIGGRVILKFRSLAGEIGWDDINIVIAVVIASPSSPIRPAHYGLGRDAWKVPFNDLENAFKSFYASTVGYKLGNMFTRMSVLCFYLRIFGSNTGFRRTTYGIIVVNICIGISFTIVDLLQCQPVSYVWNGWDGEHQGKCLSISVITWSHSILNIIMDVVTLGMAVWMVKGLKMKLRKKAAVIGMFVVGSAITLVTFLRLQALPPLENARNRTWGWAPLAYWSAIEIGAGLILACLPALKKLRYIFRARENITYQSSSTDYPKTGSQHSAAQGTKLSIPAVHLPNHLRRASKSYTTISNSGTDISSAATELASLSKSEK